jgi:hypothetical protein
VSEPDVRLVLDTSAAIAYARSSIHVGEVLAEIADERAVAALPLACLVAADPAVTDTAGLRMLAEHAATVVLTDGPDMWRELAAMAEIVGRLDASSAALAGIDFGVEVLTGSPGLYAGVGDGSMVIPIEE